MLHDATMVNTTMYSNCVGQAYGLSRHGVVSGKLDKMQERIDFVGQNVTITIV